MANIDILLLAQLDIAELEEEMNSIRRVTVPNGTVPEIVAFIEKLKREPNGPIEEEANRRDNGKEDSPRIDNLK